MTDHRPTRPRDPNQLAKLMVDIATGEAQDAPPAEKPEGRVKGGKIGGKARAEKLTPEERSEIAKKAAKARWSA
jgi:hypothetical protein